MSFSSTELVAKLTTEYLAPKNPIWKIDYVCLEKRRNCFDEYDALNVLKKKNYFKSKKNITDPKKFESDWLKFNSHKKLNQVHFHTRSRIYEVDNSQFNHIPDNSALISPMLSLSINVRLQCLNQKYWTNSYCNSDFIEQAKRSSIIDQLHESSGKSSEAIDRRLIKFYYESSFVIDDSETDSDDDDEQNLRRAYLIYNVTQLA
jgi:hypothetical protein